jgi:hypothetical protein
VLWAWQHAPDVFRGHWVEPRLHSEQCNCRAWFCRFCGLIVRLESCHRSLTKLKTTSNGVSFWRPARGPPTGPRFIQARPDFPPIHGNGALTTGCFYRNTYNYRFIRRDR